MADERDKALRAERGRQRRRKTRLQRDTAAEVIRILREAEKLVAAQLSQAESDFARARLPRLQQEIQRALQEMEDRGAGALKGGARAAWQIGVDQVDKPIEAGLAAGGVEIRLAELLATIDTRQLLAMESFLTDRMRDISATLADRIDEQLGLVVAGQRTAGEATGAIHRIFEAGGVEGGRGRALTIVRTELGRAYATATQQRLAQAKTSLPGLKKQWRRSGKVRSRTAHDLADGQIREVDAPFDVGGHQLRYPRDPRAPASETVNCGCDSLPLMESWDVRQPGRQPFSDEELRRDPRKRDLAAALGDT